jgi:hypothetical protein
VRAAWEGNDGAWAQCAGGIAEGSRRGRKGGTSGPRCVRVRVRVWRAGGRAGGAGADDAHPGLRRACVSCVIVRVRACVPVCVCLCLFVRAVSLGNDVELSGHRAAHSGRVQQQ